MRKIQLNFPTVFLISIFAPIIPIHIIPLEDIKWINWTDPQHILTLQYPSLDNWKIIEEGKQNNSNLSNNLRGIDKDVDDDYDSYNIAILHIDNSETNVKIAFNAIPLKDISDKNGFTLFKSYSSYPDSLVEHFESYGKINYPKFQVVEKHLDKYLIDENKASGILSRYSPSLGNSYGILTLYAIDKDSDLVLTFKYISDANNFMTYLPLAEKILDSIKIL